jgi:glycosyltransferase involved in cell wall biosynthesis
VTFCAYDHAQYIGGPNAWLRRLLPDLKKNAVDVEVLCITRSDPDACPTVVALKKAGVACTCLLGHGVATEQRVGWILDALADSPPDVFVPNLMVPAFYAARWVRAAGIPTVGVLHSDDAFHEAVLDEFVWGNPAYSLAALVCVSEYLAGRVRARSHGATLIRTIPCGVPVPEHTAHLADGPLRLVYTGRFSERQKRITEVVRAFCRAVREVPGTEAYLYGSGLDQAAAEAVLSREGQGLPVFIKGPVDSAVIQNELLACHVCVLLSDYEGLPISLMEAMACGLVPVCLRTQSGVPELVIDGATGLLVDDRQDCFADAVRRLRNDRMLWQQLSGAARAKVLSAYAHPGCLQRWLQLLHELAMAGNARAPVRVPQRISLPPVRPGLAREDTRAPRGLARLSTYLQKLSGRLKGG